MAQISLEEEYRKIAGDQSVLGDPSGEPAYLYSRSSDSKQAEEGRESLSRQLVFADERGKRDGYYVPREMVYWDVWTGSEVDRPAFYEMLADVKKNKRSDAVLIDQTDRLSRNKAVYYVLSYELTKYGLEAIFEDEEDEMVRHIKLVFDELELEKRRYRQIQANKARARKGYVTSKIPAYGYDFTEDGKQYVINEEEAHWVRKMYEWYVSGWIDKDTRASLHAIAVRLNQFEVETSQTADAWSPSAVSIILKNENYKGVYIANRQEHIHVWEGGRRIRRNRERPKEEWIYVDVPAIVSEEMWEQAQKRFAHNKKFSGKVQQNEWLLYGITRCTCGYTISCQKSKIKRTLKSGEKKTYEYYYYLCSDRHRTWRTTCDRKKIDRDVLEGYVLEALDGLFSDPHDLQHALEHESDGINHLKDHVEFHENQIEELDARMNQLLDLVLEQRTETTRKLFDEKQAQLERQREQHSEQLQIAHDRLQEAEKKVGKRELAEHLLQFLRSTGGLSGLDFEAQRAIITELIDEIVVDTTEEWFEIDGILKGRFKWDKDLSSVRRLGCKP